MRLNVRLSRENLSWGENNDDVLFKGGAKVFRELSIESKRENCEFFNKGRCEGCLLFNPGRQQARR